MRSWILFLSFVSCVHLSAAQLTWIKSTSNPVLPTWSGDIDDPSSYKYCIGPAVVYDDSLKLYRAWFISMAYGYGTSFCVSEAISLDGLRWYALVKNPVVRPSLSGFDSRSIYNPCVIRDATGFKMYYAGYDGTRFALGLATSMDGITWTKHPSNPIIPGGAAGTWNYDVRQASVVVQGGTFHMWLDARSSSGEWSIGYATSLDGINWSIDAASPIMTKGAVGTFEETGVGEPVVVYDGNAYHMLYTGYAPPGLTGRIGYARSTDGLAWLRSPSNPVLNLGPSGTWDDAHVAAGTLMLRDSILQVWYVGYDGATYQVGHAHADLSTAVIELPHDGVDMNGGFRLLANYPNPFNGTTRISCYLPESSSVSVWVYDVLGREIAVISRRESAPGVFTVSWDGRNIAGNEVGSGMYLVSVTADGVSGKRYAATEKLMLTK
jgi:hypothetical protein